MVYEAITKFGWDQEGMKVKVYITSGLDGVGAIGKDNVTCEFEDKSFDLRVHNLNGKNYRLRIPELQDTIELSDCKFQVKSNSITITLKKSKNESWTDLKPKQTLLGKKEKKKEDEDPMASLMGMMKEMYQNGDEKTKAMIAESWQKAQNEKDKKAK